MQELGGKAPPLTNDFRAALLAIIIANAAAAYITEAACRRLLKVIAAWRQRRELGAAALRPGSSDTVSLRHAPEL